VEEYRIWDVLDYVESNPVRACMVKHAWEWEWASSQAHVTGHDSSGLLDMEIWRRIFTAEKWRDYLEREKKDGSIAAIIRRATMKGHFLGKDETALRLEKELGKQLLPRKRGRKPKG
jgi:putative transposase